MKADAKQLICLKAILHSFALSIGLRVNYSKSNMFPINIDQERYVILQALSVARLEASLLLTLDFL
jgi:hypothetical protein